MLWCLIFDNWWVCLSCFMTYCHCCALKYIFSFMASDSTEAKKQSLHKKHKCGPSTFFFPLPLFLVSRALSYGCINYTCATMWGFAPVFSKYHTNTEMPLSDALIFQASQLGSLCWIRWGLLIRMLKQTSKHSPGPRWPYIQCIRTRAWKLKRLDLSCEILSITYLMFQPG